MGFEIKKTVTLVLVFGIFIFSACFDKQSPEGKGQRNSQNDMYEIKAASVGLPKSLLSNTSSKLQVADSQRSGQEPIPAFYVPADVELVSLNKPVMSSDSAPIMGDLQMITDGDKDEYEGSYVELGPFLQHVTVDLGAKLELYAIVVWHYYSQPRIYQDVIVQTADDINMTTNVNTLFNNDHDNSAGMGMGADQDYVETAEGKIIDAEGISGRYIRLYSNGNSQNDLNHYIEVSVYGKQIDKGE